MSKSKIKTPKYLFNTITDDNVWVRGWKEKREIVVQVWLSGKPEGEPDGDWAMPGVLGVAASIDQAVLQTRADAKAKGNPEA